MELREYILDNFDPDDLLEALNLSTEDIVDAFPDKIEENKYKFIDESVVEDIEDE